MRKSLTAAVVSATIAWSLSLSALFAPLAALGASSGALVKASTPAVYYVGADGKRYVFPNQTTYKTWYADFSAVTTLTDAELAAMTVGGNVCMKPGALMVKITTDPKVYAVDRNCTLRWVPSEAIAAALYGSDWNKKIVDVPDAFFTNYSVGSDLSAAADFSPASASAAAASINADRGIGGTAASSGKLSVALAPTNPPSNTFVGGIGVSMMEIAVTNTGSTTAAVTSVTLHRRGAGGNTDIAGLYLFHGYDRLTSMVTINSTSNDAAFNSVILDVAPGTTEVLSVIAGFNYFLGGSNQHALDLIDLKSGNLTARGLPLHGNLFTMSPANSGLLSVDKSGPAPLSNVVSGGKHQKIGEFKFTLDGTEDMDFASLALTHGGSVARERLSNLSLESAGNALATVAKYDRYDRATFVLATPVTLTKNNSRTFSLYADIAPESRGGTAETIFTYVDDPVDVAAYGHVYGFASAVVTTTANGASYDGDSCALGAGNCSSTRIESGTLTTSFNGPASKNLAAAAKSVELFNFTMSALAKLDVRKLQLAVSGDGASALDNGSLSSPRITNIKVIDTASGTTVLGPKDVTGATGYLVGAASATLDFSETFTLPAGQSRTFKVVADVANASILGPLSKLRVSLNKFSALASAIKNVDTNQDLTSSDYVPDSVIAGNQFSLAPATLAVSAASTPVAQSYVKGSQGVALMGLSLKAGDGSPVTISSLQLQGRIDSSDNSGVCTNAPNGAFSNGREPAGCASVADDVQTVTLWNGSTQLGAAKSPASGTDGSLTFDTLNLIVPSGQTVTLQLRGNLASSMAAGTLPDDVSFQLTGGNVSATDADGNALAATGTANGPAMRLTDGGTVTTAVSSDSSTETDAGLLLGSASSVTLAKFRFSAQYEDLKLTKARINVATPNAVSSLSLYDGGTMIAGPVSVDGSGNADFSGITGFVIAKDSSKNLTVKGTLNAVGPSGATTGSAVTATLKDTAGTLEIRGASAGSSTLITSIGGDMVGNAKIVRKAVPTVSLAALPTATLTAGQNVAMRFTVSAGGGDVALKGLAMLVNNGTSGTITNISNGDSQLRRVGDSSNLAGSSALTACGAAATCTLVLRLANEETVAAGSSRTYDIRLNVGAASVGSSVTGHLLGDDGATLLDTGALTVAGDTAHYPFAVDGTDSEFVWSDQSASPHDATVGASSADWANGGYVKVVPTDSQTLSK